MKIVVIDGQGGGLGSNIIQRIKDYYSDAFEIVALATNSIAVSRMIKAGAKKGASGENPFRVILTEADIIIGPIAVAVPNSMLGEITEKMAVSVSRSNAYKLFIPSDKCGINICGLKDVGMNDLLSEMMKRLDIYLKNTEKK